LLADVLSGPRSGAAGGGAVSRRVHLAEAANILGEPIGTLAWRISEGVKTLRGLLADEPRTQSRPRSNLTQEVQPDVSEGS
jgi:hypothetical protein